MGNISEYYDFDNDAYSFAQRVSEFGVIYRKIINSLGLALSEEFKSLLLNRNILDRAIEFLFKTDEGHTKYQSQAPLIDRKQSIDRVFPLETVELQRFKNETDLDTGSVLIHTGSYADEYSRSFNALALVFGNDIFFRNGAFNTSTEEGRKTLAHELTHVAQYKDGRIKNSTREELEAEAENNEAVAGYTDNPFIVFKIGNKLCRIKKSELKTFVSQIADEVERRLEMKKYGLEEEKYLRLLTEYEKMLKGA